MEKGKTMRLIDADALMEQPIWLCGGWVGDSYAEGYMDALDKFEETVKSAPTVDAEPRWIPCEEKLPEQEEKVYLVYLEDGHICDCKWWCRNLISLEPTEQWRWDILDLPQYGRVLAWMPLPEPYDGERKDNEDS